MPEPPEYPTVQGCQAATTRSSLDLLALPYPFSQVGLLTPDKFAEQAARRRSWAMRGLPPINAQVLEELHRCGVVVPLFRVDLTPGPKARGIDLSTSLTAQHVHTTAINELLRGASEGRVIDPATAQFEAWPRDRRRSLWPSVDAGYLYSRHQLPSLDRAMSFVSDLTPQRPDKVVAWHLGEADLPNQPTREALRSWRGLAITLLALDTYYWFFITHTISHDLQALRQVLRTFDRPAMLDWLGLSLDQITGEAARLRSLASVRDDTGEFYELIRRAKADAWDSLKGDAAVAMDLRLAADILDRFSEELDPSPSPAGPGYVAPLSQQGLGNRPKSLDGALTGLRLSPFPSLVIGVEGETEYRLVPRVMNLLEIELDPNWIKIVNFEGTGDLSLLARYAAEPMLGRDFGSSVALDRPLTRFLVMADAENKFKEAADRRKQRRLLLESLTKNVPLDLRSDYYINSRRDRIVEIRTWGELPFEFAHFKDSQLADAMLKIAKVPHPQDRAQLISNLHRKRTSRAPNVDKVRWPGSDLSKPALADALWPVLEEQINTAIERGQKGPPIMHACIRAYEMATVTYGVPIVLRRRRWRPRR